MPDLTHIAGLRIQIAEQIRQRCAWCGAVLIDVDLTRTAFEADDPNPTVATWEVGAQVHTSDSFSCIVTPAEGALAEDSCSRLDHEVTR